MASWTMCSISSRSFSMAVWGIKSNDAFTSHSFLTCRLSQLPHWCLLTTSSKTSSYSAAENRTIVLLLSIKWDLTSTEMFSCTAWAGYITRAPHFTVVAVLSDNILTNSTALLSPFDLFSLNKVLAFLVPWLYCSQFRKCLKSKRL